MNTLYPLKFKPILKEKIWGGNKLHTLLNKPGNPDQKIGESWEISGVNGDVSVVANGFLQDNSLEELIEIYMGDLIGDKIYEQFGMEFPILIKFIDANDYLSIQVHPDDDMAKERHESYGKTEMWYIVNAEKNAELIAGFNQEMDKTKYLQHFGSGTLRDVLNFEKVDKGDVFFMPAGRVHATGPGILFAEIQQTSDITYRIYDWDRVGEDGKPREMHTELAVDAIDYTYHKELKTPYKPEQNQSSEIVKCNYFTTNVIELNQKINKDYNWLDSFVIYMGIEGDTKITYNNEEQIILQKGESILIPAVLTELSIEPTNNESKILEVYID